MAAKIAKYIGFSVFGLLILAVGALFVTNDKTIETSGGPLASPALSLKHGILGAFHSVAGSDESDGDSKTPRVVQDLPPAPVPEAVATPVQTRSLADIAAETQQEYARRDASDGVGQGMIQAPPASDDLTSTEDVASLNDLTSPVSEAMGAPPAPPALTETNDTTTGMDAPEGSSDPTSLLDTEPDASAPEPDSEELALLESLEQAPSNDVAALPPETAEENENIESAIEEEADSDPTGEKAYAEGLKFYSGDGIERNFGSAAQLFMQAAERGHAEAQYSLGLMNYVGQTGGQDFSNAAKWFQMAAESGHIQAQYNLGFLYYEGKGVQQDLKTAFGWIDRAAQQGYAKAVKARDALQKAMPEMFGS